ncbi:hypothetical protein [Bailinhaonella thermotolerans]|uniref:hypothetical protein n=1 Tax=Bailinhaonella thermotolerans TaxID=1070861 RepID=UPI000E75F971|nr:hypothetical protein [Bailinhaonella thermotolerans]
MGGLATVLGWLHDGLLAAALAALVLPLLYGLAVLLTGVRFGESRADRVLREAHGRYIGPDDLGDARSEPWSPAHSKPSTSCSTRT